MEGKIISKINDKILKKYGLINLPCSRKIKFIDKDYPGIIPDYFEMVMEIQEFCARNNYSKKKMKRLIERKLEEEYHLLSFGDIEEKMKDPNSEIIVIARNIAMNILKKKKNYIGFDSLFEIVSDLKGGTKYVAYFGFDFFASKPLNSELIELEDFEFQFHSKSNIEYLVKTLEIFDSEFFEFKKKIDFYKGRFISYNNFFEDLKSKKYIEIGEAVYKYLDTKYFTTYGKLPSYYPDKSEEITQKLNFD